MKILFFVKKKEVDWSYGRLFKNWAAILNSETVEDEGKLNKLSKDADFIIADDVLSLGLVKKYPDLVPKIIPYAQTLFGLNFLRNGKKGILRRTASLIPFYLIDRFYVERMRMFNIIFANSFGTSSLLHNLYNIYSNYVVYPGVDEQRFSPTKDKKNMVLIYASAPYLSEILDPVDIKAVKHIISCSKKLGYEVHSFGRQMPFNSEIIQHVNIGTDDLIDLYSSSVVTFTPQPLELFGLVPIESMSCGTPVISTYHHEAMMPGINGEVLDRKRLKDSIKSLSEVQPRIIRDSVKDFYLTKSANNLLKTLCKIYGDGARWSEI